VVVDTDAASWTRLQHVLRSFSDHIPHQPHGALARRRLPPDLKDIVSLGSLGFDWIREVADAIIQGGIDATAGGQKTIYQKSEVKSGRRFGDRDALARLPITAIAFGPNLLQRRPQVACAYVRASLRAAREVLKANYNENQRVVAALAKETGNTEAVVHATRSLKLSHRDRE
jgi:ABC-type nitrate/sulfonate/bicarbonate transport system substrate-binding protein